jgi:hypothetical protein
MKNTTGSRQQKTENIAQLLRDAVPPVGDSPGPPHDLWPMIEVRVNAQPALAQRVKAVPWFDWALAAGLAVFALSFPVTMPVLLYYL